MSLVKTFFRHCPNCGRRFEIRLVSKQVVTEENESVSAGGTPSSASYGVPSGGGQSTGFVDLHMGSEPVMVDVKEFKYAYHCSHCGHTWTELEIKD